METSKNISNMRIWDSVCKTDPSHTKRVSQRGGFTAIDAQYQIKMATEEFGPIGIGWGYETIKVERMDQYILTHVELWHGDRSNKFGPILGCAEMFGKRPDGDAPKKAVTDAITKGLSQLGFNADVFLGLFDDSQYVENRRKEEERSKRPVVPSEVLHAIETANSLDTLAAAWSAHRDWQKHDDFMSAKEKRKKQLQEAA